MRRAHLPQWPATPAHTYLGRGFDTCDAPPLKTMTAWWGASDYQALGVYIGGLNRSCLQGNLTPDWVTAVSTLGWKLLPVYVGPQAPCVRHPGLQVLDPATVQAQAAVSAADAALKALALGLQQGSAIYFDLEAYDDSADPGCVSTAMTFIAAWTRGLHGLGFLAGVYSSASSGIADIAATAAGNPASTSPDALWIAHWDGKPTVLDPALPNGFLGQHQRIKQYAGGHQETYAGVPLNIDTDWLDGPVAVVG